MASGDNFTMKTEMKKIKSNRCVCIPLVVLKARRDETKQNKTKTKYEEWKMEIFRST